MADSKRKAEEEIINTKCKNESLHVRCLSPWKLSGSEVNKEVPFLISNCKVPLDFRGSVYAEIQPSVVGENAKFWSIT